MAHQRPNRIATAHYDRSCEAFALQQSVTPLPMAICKKMSMPSLGLDSKDAIESYLKAFPLAALVPVRELVPCDCGVAILREIDAKEAGIHIPSHKRANCRKSYIRPHQQPPAAVCPQLKSPYQRQSGIFLAHEADVSTLSGALAILQNNFGAFTADSNWNMRNA